MQRSPAGGGANNTGSGGWLILSGQFFESVTPHLTQEDVCLSMEKLTMQKEITTV